MSFWEDIRNLIGQRQVNISVRDLLTADDINSLLRDFEADRLDCDNLILIYRNGKSVKLGLAGECAGDDIKTLSLLAAAAAMVVGGGDDGR